MPRLSSKSSAFTLIELLTVIAIIGVLAGITFGVVGGVRERAAISKARGELSLLQVALDQYKRQYGDYPHTSDSDELLQSLVGKRGPKGAAMNGKSLIEITKFTLSDPTKDPSNDSTLTLVDPWGSPYAYVYKGASASSWRQASFLLYSKGPDKSDTPPDSASGAYSADDSGNSDNVFVER